MAASTEVGIRLSLSGANEVAAGTDRVGQSFGRMQGSARSASEAALSLRGALGGIASVATVAAFVKLADSVTTLRTQLLLATGSAKQAGVAFSELYQIAQQGRVSFTELGTTYAAIARAGNELGVSQSRLLAVTQSISQAMTIGGGSAQAMQAALVQLSQGLGAGTLRGEELNSIMEQTPRLAKAIADGMGVPIGELRKLGEAGQLTAQQVISALEKAGPQLAKEMQSATLTVGQAMTMLGNSTTKLIGDMDSASGASTAMAKAVQGIASAMDSVGSVIRNNETAFALVANGLAGAATVAGVAALARGIYLAATAVGAFGAAWLATPLGPVVAALAAVTGAIYGLQAAAEKSSKSEYGIKADLIITEEQIAKLESRGNRLADEGRKRLDTLREQRAKLQAELALVTNANLDTRAEDARFGAGAAAARERDKVAKEYESIKSALSGVNANFQTHLKQLDAARQEGLISEAQYVEDVKDLIAKEGGARKEAAEKATSHLAQQKKAAAEFLADLQAQAAQAEAVAGQRKDLTEEQKALAKAEEMVREGRARDKDLDRDAIAAAARRIDLAKASAAAYAEQARAYQASLDTAAKENTSLADQNEKLRQSIALIGLTKEAVNALEDARMGNTIAIEEERMAMANLHGASMEELALMKQHIGLLKERRALMREAVGKNAGVDAEREAVKAAQEATAEWQRGWSETDRIAREAFTTWATEGGSAAQKIGDTLKKALLSAIYEATLKPLVFQVYSSVTGGGGVAGTALQAASGASGGIGSLGSLGTAASAFGGTFATGFMNTLTTGSVGTGLSAAGSMMGQGFWSQGLGMAAGSLGPVIAGIAAIQALSSYTVDAKGNYLLANASGSGLSGQVARRDDYQQNSSGIFSGGTTQNSDWSRAGESIDAYFDAAIKSSTTAARQYAAALGLPVDALDGYAKQIEVSITGLDAAGQKAAIDKAIGTFMADMVSSAYGGALAGLAREGETSAQTLQRVATNLVAVNAALGTLGGTALTAGAAGAQAASTLVDAFGGVDQMGQTVGAYYNAFYTDAERAAQSAAALGDQFAALGVQMPATKQEFRALVDSIDITTTSGAKLAASVLGLAPAFDAAAQSAAAAANNLLSAAKNWGTSADVRSIQAQILQRSLADSGLNVDIGTIMGATKDSVLQYYKTLDPNSATARALLDNQQAIYDFVTSGQTPALAGGSGSGGGSSAGVAAADSIASAWQSITDSIWGEVKRIRGLIEGTGPDAFAAAQARFVTATAQARAGDQSAAAQLPDLSRAMLDLAQTSATTLAQLRVTQGQTAASLAQTASLLSGTYGLQVPFLDTGTNLVPRDMLAVVHQGEAIIPAPYNPAFTQGGTGATQGQQAAEIAALREDVRAGQAQIAALMRELVRMNKKWDGEGLPETRTV